MTYIIFYIFNFIFYYNIYFMRLMLVVESTVVLNTRRIREAFKNVLADFFSVKGVPPLLNGKSAKNILKKSVKKG